MKLSVVIVNYNVRYFLEQCLRSVFRALGDIPAEVFVVDNASVDGSVDMVRNKFPDTIVIANGNNVGFATANNQAIRACKGEYILLLNPDTLVEEQTFHKVIRFMDQHPEAGGLGVKMVDGKGVFLPESKRGLPTPFVSFCKISGLSSLFKKSATLNRYHLGHLDKEKNHSIEILSGAFMLLRKRAIDEVGLLDEAFFMYGEDIDLSWRLILGGWKNYYFAETSIIHYKGESTKKGSLNYVYVFYQAMAIFARKHFSHKNAGIYNFFIHTAIWVRALLAWFKRIVAFSALPLLDVGLIAILWVMIKSWYSLSTGILYNPSLFHVAMLLSISVWVFCLWLFGAYDHPRKPSKVFLPVVTGSALILLGYSLLPETLRFSRALILLGSIIALVMLFFNRWALGLSTSRKAEPIRTIILGAHEEKKRVEAVLNSTHVKCEVFPVSQPLINAFLTSGGAPSFSDFLRVEKIKQVIFCAADIDAATIISLMAFGGNNVEYKIVPPEALFIIGSGKINTAGGDIVQEINSIVLPYNRRLKRCTDVGVALVLIITSPISMWFANRPFRVLKNCVHVILNRKSWVGKTVLSPQLPAISILRPGVIMPSQNSGRSVSEHVSEKKHLLYIKDYSPLFDLRLIWVARKNWGD
jgi:GT2 family glycosyltransferase